MRQALVIAIAFLGMVVIAPPDAQAAPQQEAQDAARLLPDSIVLYVEAPRPPQLLSALFEHPLRRRVESLPDVQQVLDQPQVRQLRIVVDMVETNLKMDLQKALSAAAHQGAWLAVDGATKGAVLMVHAQDAEVLNNVRETLFTLVRAGALGQKRPDPIQTVEYRGLSAYRVDRLRIATWDQWLVATNNSDLGKKILDQHLDGGEHHLASSERFQSAWGKRPADAGVWAYLDVQALRMAGAAEKVFAGRTENPLAELLFGGPLSNLQHTPYVTASLQVNDQGMSLAVAAPHDPSWIGPEREFYFGPRGLGEALPLLQPEGSIFTLSAYRGIDQMWLHAGDLFEQGVSDELAKADSNLTTLFAGRDFGEDVLGALQPQVRLVVARQDMSGALPQPAIKLPEFAAMFRLREPDTMRDEFRRTLQSLIGFLNVAGAQNGQPQLDFSVQRNGNQQMVTSEYVPEDNEKDSRQARIVFNFSPTALFEGDWMALCSTQRLAQRLPKAPKSESAEALNTHARLFAAPLQQILRDNRLQLVAQNMLEEGNSKEQAEHQIDMLLEIVGWFSGAELKMSQATDQLTLQLQVAVAQSKDKP